MGSWFFFFFQEKTKLSSRTSLSISVTLKLLEHITGTISVHFEGQSNAATLNLNGRSCRAVRASCNLASVSDFHLKDLLLECEDLCLCIVKGHL